MSEWRWPVTRPCGSGFEKSDEKVRSEWASQQANMVKRGASAIEKRSSRWMLQTESILAEEWETSRFRSSEPPLVSAGAKIRLELPAIHMRRLLPKCGGVKPDEESAIRNRPSEGLPSLVSKSHLDILSAKQLANNIFPAAIAKKCSRKRSSFRCLLLRHC